MNSLQRLPPQQQVGLLLLVLLLLFSFRGALFRNPLALVVTLLALVVAITVHEFGHAWVADLLGDHTARSMGRVSFNPVVHFDPVGALMILFTLTSGFGIGWGRPVMVNPRNLAGGRNGMALVAIAGVMMNLLCAVICAVALRLLTPFSGSFAMGQALLTLLFVLISVNVYLAAFNFIVALPPLDGFNFLVNVLPIGAAYSFGQLARYGPILLLLVIIASQLGLFGFNLIGTVVGVPAQYVIRMLTGVA